MMPEGPPTCLTLWTNTGHPSHPHADIVRSQWRNQRWKSKGYENFWNVFETFEDCFLCIITLFYRHIYVYVGSHRYTTVVDKLDLRRSPSPNKNPGYAYGSQFNFTGFVVAPSEHFVVLVKCYWALAGRSS